MNYTQNYHLPQWVKSDRVRMEDFNEAMASLESGLTAALQKAAEAEAKAVAAEQKAAQALQTAEESYYVGYYNGTGRALYVELGWKPKLVLVAGMKTSTTQGDYSTFDHYFAMTGRGDGLSKRIEISAKGFTVYPDNYQGAWHPSLIEDGRRYDYIAFR